VQRVKANKRRVTDRKTPPNSVGDHFSYEGYGGNQTGDYCCTSEAHLPSGQNVTNKRSCHHEKKNNNAGIS